MVIVDMKRLREALPKHAKLDLRHVTKPPTYVFLECRIQNPSLSDMYPLEYEQMFEEIKQWQREIIGKEAINEFYTETTGEHWYVYLNRIQLEFINTTDDDVQSYSGFSIAQLTK